MIYADSSFIAACYLEDEHTPAARSYSVTHHPRLPFIFLHWPELAKAITAQSADAEADWEAIKTDVLAGETLYAATVDAERTGRRAAGLLRHFYPRWKKLRSLDAMHVAAAVESGCKIFLSFDTNSCQRILAATQKLEVWPALTKDERARLE